MATPRFDSGEGRSGEVRPDWCRKMLGYDFLSDDESTAQDNNDDDTEPFSVKKWSLGDHEESPDMDWDVLEAEMEHLEDQAPGLAGALDEAKAITRKYNVSGFECSVCGLNHSHSDSKHDIREAFDVTEEFAEEMKFSPFCHCGVSELARLVMYFPDVEGVIMFHDQNQFEEVMELDSERVRNIYRIYNEMSGIEAREKYGVQTTGDSLSVGEAREVEAYESNHAHSVMPLYEDALKLFFGKINRIKGAAVSAPIPSETEQSLNENLGEL